MKHSLHCCDPVESPRMVSVYQALGTASNSKLALFLIAYHPLVGLSYSFWALWLAVTERGVPVTQNNILSREHGRKNPEKTVACLWPLLPKYLHPVLSFLTLQIPSPSSTGKNSVCPIWEWGMMLAKSQLQVVLYLYPHYHLVYNCKVLPDLAIKKEL